MDADEAIRLAETVRPDIILLDVAMPRVSGLEVLHTLAAPPNAPRVLILTAAIDRADIIRALQLGARGVVLKESATGLLMQAIRIVMQGGYWVGRESVSDLLLALESLGSDSERGAKLPDYSLTPRELQIVQLVVEAAGNKKIAETLAISEKTVKHHLTNIFDKMGVSNRLELALFALHHRLAPGQSES
jgi:DNA-binding NarL/FixJ family response regulator